MADFLLLDQNLPYAVALTLVALAVGLELLGLVLGMSPGNALDELIPFETSAVAPSSWSRLGMGSVPSYLWLLIFLGCFGLAGVGVNLAAAQLLGGPASVPYSLPVSLALGLGATSIAARVAGRLLPQEESYASATRDLEGRTATIKLGLATRGSPAEASLVDEHGQRHYLMVEPLEGSETFEQGDEVLLVGKSEGAWLGVGHGKEHR